MKKVAGRTSFGWRSAPSRLAFIVYGLSGFDHFEEHVVAELIGVCLSIPVTVLVVEAILTKRRSEYSAQVRQQTGIATKLSRNARPSASTSQFRAVRPRDESRPR
jgi:hypothetical protein